MTTTQLNFEGTRTILSEIEDKRSKLVLIESDKKAYGANLDDALSDCKKRIQDIRKENSKLRRQLFERMNSDEHIISEAFQRKSRDRALFIKKSSTEASEILNHRMCDRAKHLNLLKYLTEIKYTKLQSVEMSYKNLNLEIKFVSDTIAGLNQLGQQIRNLENRLDKYTLKLCEVQHINDVYGKIVRQLQEEQLNYGNSLDGLEKEISGCKIELCNLLVIKKDAEMSRDAIINELRVKEDFVYHEKKRRETELHFIKQVVENDHVFNEKKNDIRYSNAVDRIPILTNTDWLNEEIEYKMNKYCKAFKEIQEISGVLDIEEVISRFEEQNSTEKLLRRIIEDLENINVHHHQQIESSRCALRTKTYESGMKCFDHEDDITKAENFLLNNDFQGKDLKYKLTMVNVTLTLCKQSAEHIHEVMSRCQCDSYFENDLKCNFVDFIMHLFVSCDVRATKLMLEMNQIEDMNKYKKLCSPPIIETYNEFYFNIVKNISINNSRINVKVNLKIIKDDHDHESEEEEDNNVLTRRTLKKLSYQFVELKTKKIVKKNKKLKEK